MLRNEFRAVPGMYEGVYDRNGKLLAAKSETLTTPTMQAKLAAEKLASDRAQASMIGGLMDDVSPSSLKDPDRSSNRGQEGTASDVVSPFSIADAEDLLAPANDQTVGDKSSGGALDTALLKLMSSLCQKIKDLGSGIEEGNTTIIRALRQNKTTPPVKSSALRPSSFDATTVDERAAVSSTARRHAKAARSEAPRGSEGEEDIREVRRDEGDDGVGVDNDGWPCNDPDWGPYEPTKKSRTKKTSRKKSSSRTRLYAIAKGRGGQQTVGLYREEWEDIEFLVHAKNSRYKRVRSESEGISFIKSFLRKKNLPKPKWVKEGTVPYPRVAALCRQFEMGDSDSIEDGSSSDSYSSGDSSPKQRKVLRTEGTKAGVDKSMGKDNELFGVDVKSVAVLERGIAPANLGKHTISLFLEQIDDMTAYPRHTHHKTSESLGDFVEAVTDLG